MLEDGKQNLQILSGQLNSEECEECDILTWSFQIKCLWWKKYEDLFIYYF